MSRQITATYLVGYSLTCVSPESLLQHQHPLATLSTPRSSACPPLCLISPTKTTLCTYIHETNVHLKYLGHRGFWGFSVKISLALKTRLGHGNTKLVVSLTVDRKNIASLQRKTGWGQGQRIKVLFSKTLIWTCLTLKAKKKYNKS